MFGMMTRPRVVRQLAPRLCDASVSVWISYTPGCFLGPGPYGCLGSGTGYTLAAALAHPDRQTVVLYGDGAIGFSLGDLDSLARHGANLVGIVGNNGIWGLEKHPMQALFGYDVICDLAPATRYDLVAQDLGCHGELVDRAGGARSGARPRVRVRRPRPRQCAHRPGRRLPAFEQFGVSGRPHRRPDRPTKGAERPYIAAEGFVHDAAVLLVAAHEVAALLGSRLEFERWTA